MKAEDLMTLTPEELEKELSVLCPNDPEKEEVLRLIIKTCKDGELVQKAYGLLQSGSPEDRAEALKILED